MMKKTVTVSIDESLYTLISDLARDDRRSIPNFIGRLLKVSLSEPLDRQALFEKMNPSLAVAFSRIAKERARVEALPK